MADRKINKIARLEIPFSKPEDLTIGEKYQITDMNYTDTKYGKKVTVTLNNDKCIIYLPARVSSALVNDTDEYAYHKSKCMENRLYIRFLEGLYNKCEFLYDN